MAVNTYKEISFNRLDEDYIIKVGDIASGKLVVAGMYDNIYSGKIHVVFTTPTNPADYVLHSEGQALIDKINQTGEYQGQNVKDFGFCRYATSRTKDFDMLQMMHENRNEIGGFEATRNNRFASVFGDNYWYDKSHVHIQDFTNSAYTKSTVFHTPKYYKPRKAAIRPIWELNLENVVSNQITFGARHHTPNQ